MIQLQRHERILKYLTEHEFLTVKDAVRIFQASPATIRRDFGDLAQQSLVRRTRGGVKFERGFEQGMTPFALRETQYSVEKEALARQACSLLKPGEVIFIDGGTTTFHLTTWLPNQNLRIITNSLRFANAMEERRKEKSLVEIYLTGGYLYPNSGILLGPNAVTSLSHYHANWAMLSAEGITDAGISNTNDLVVEAERAMLEHADKVAILADHSKIGKRAMCHVCGLDQIDLLITAAWSDNDETLLKFKDQGLEILLCPLK